MADKGASTEIVESIGQHLGRYRMFAADRDTTPGVRETIAHLDTVTKSINRLIEDLDLIPAEADAYITETLWYAYKEHGMSMANRIMRDLQDFATMFTT